MRLLMISQSYLPDQFSEALCNAKLAIAMQERGVILDVISHHDCIGPSYDSTWSEPWLSLRDNTYPLTYPVGNKMTRLLDYFRSGVKMGGNFRNGIRWARRAYEKALQLLTENKYDAVLTRSPNDIAHLVGWKLKQTRGISWIANWNDPANPIWPEPYTHRLSEKCQKMEMEFTEFLLKNADRNTFPSKRLMEHFQTMFPTLVKSKCKVIPHILMSIVPHNENTQAKGEIFRLCHSGNMSKERNPEFLFIALRNCINNGMSSFHLDILGRTNDFISELIDKYNLSAYVTCVKGKPYFEALKTMAQYNCLVLLEAKVENGIFFPSKVTDYVALGKPIWAISPKEGFAHDLLGCNVGGVFSDNSSPKDIENGFQRLYLMWQQNKLQHLSSNTIRKQFSEDYVVGLYKSLIESI